MDCQLHPRAVEAIRWIADGRTHREAAALMGVKPMQVYRLLVRAKDATGTPTTAALVATALRQHIID